MKDKKEYTAPKLTVASIKSERGYAGSVDLFFWLSLQNSSTEQMEAYEATNGWTEGDNTFWN